jgi:hypothetical protein
MKTLTFTLFSCAILYVGANAQPTITSADAFSVGDVPTYQGADTTGVDEGSSGTNQTWNFANLTNQGGPLSETFVSPGTTPFAASFPTATVALDDGAGTYVYYNVTSTESNLLGLGSPSLLLPYSDSQKYFQYPFTYNTSFTDNIAATFTIATYPGTRTGFVTFLADGYGTLILPTGTVNNALRIKYTQHDIDAVDYGSGNVITTTTDVTTYFWMTPGNTNSLMSINYVTTTVLSFSTSSKSVNYYPGTINTGLEDPYYAINSPLLFPNPAADEATISFGVPEAGDVRISVMNISGQVIRAAQTSVPAGGNVSEKIMLEGLAAGTYFVSLDMDNRHLFTRQIIKQ